PSSSWTASVTVSGASTSRAYGGRARSALDDRRQLRVCHDRAVTDQAWDDEADEVIRSDITTALAYVTPAGGAVVTAVAPCGLADRDQATVGFTTSLGFAKKLERIIREPRIALAYHTREHGYSTSPRFVLVQGDASVDL